MENLRAAIKTGHQEAVKVELDALLGEGHSAGELLDVMIESLRQVGEAFSKGDAFVPEMLIAAEAMRAGSDHLGPELIKSSDGTKLGKFMIATVSGDLHDVGKNLVALVFTGNGFDVVDLGVDVSASRIVAAFAAKIFAALVIVEHGMKDYTMGWVFIAVCALAGIFASFFIRTYAPVQTMNRIKS
jgi:methanogenic corrinoid protein MtbC1